QHLNGATDLRVASDQRIDFTFARFLVEVYAIGLERVPFLFGIVPRLGVGLLVTPAHRPGLGHARALGNAVTDIVDGIVARHVLLLQEIGGVALALGKDRNQDIRAGDLLASG